MTSNQAREQRREVVEGLRTALRVISAGNACLRSIEACEAMATCYQAVGRLGAIDEQECYAEACSQGKPARSPRPSIIPDPEPKPMSYGERMATQPYVPESIALPLRSIPEDARCNLTADQLYEAAFHKARQDEPSMPDSVLEAMAEAWDRGDIDATQAIVNAVKLNGRAL